MWLAGCHPSRGLTWALGPEWLLGTTWWAGSSALDPNQEGKYDLRCGEKGSLFYCWWECKLMQPLWRHLWNSLKNQQSHSWACTGEPELKRHLHPAFTAAPTETARAWEQLEHLSAGECVKETSVRILRERTFTSMKRDTLTQSQGVEEPRAYYMR